MSKLANVQAFGMQLCQNIMKTHKTVCKAGSLKYLLWGPIPSEQSICIKMGHVGEELAKEMIKSNNLELLTCGPQVINENGKKKDFDLIWIDHEKQTIFLRELKGNIELDSEKLPATFEKIRTEFEPWLKSQYPNFTINVGILNWSVYDRSDLSAGLSNIKTCEKAGVIVDHFGDFCNLIDFEWPKENFYNYWHEIGAVFRNISSS